VRRMSERKNGTRRMPRGLAIIICYIVFIAAVVGFMFLLVPRLSRDIARLGKEAPGLAKKVDKEYVPSVARWLEERFPSLRVVKQTPEEQPIVPDVPLPPGTAATITPLPDGRLALELTANGVDIKPTADGGFHVQALENPPEAATLEEKLRAYAKHAVLGLQSRLNDVARVLQDVITGFIKGIFGFFFTLMIVALFFGEYSYGLVGALLAVPILSAISVVFMYLYRKKWKDGPRSGPIAKPVELPPTKT
jgi:hypothetical protein